MRLTLRFLNGINRGGEPWREAATLIVASSPNQNGKITTSSSSDPTGSSVHYLVTQRSPKSAFMPNGLCFPGGTVSPADSTKKWLNLFNKAGIDLRSLTFLDPAAHRPPMYTSKVGEPFSREIILRLAAIRETFEESGVLICKSSHPESPILDKKEIPKWQKEVKGDAEAFLLLCEEFRILPDLESLIEWSNWLTPTTFSPRQRFDTLFYVTVVGHPPNLVIDQEEVVDAFTATAAQLVEGRHKTGALLPPQIYELKRMKGIQDIATLEMFAKMRQKKGLERWCSNSLKIKDGGLHILPGDDLYQPSDIENGIENRPQLDLDSTFADLQKSTKNYNRMQSTKNEGVQILVNIAPSYGQVYPSP